MNHAELIERVARLEPVDRVPFALLSSGSWAINSKGCTLENALAEPAETVADWLYEGYTAADSAMSWVGSGYFNIVIRALGGKIKWRKKGTPDVSEVLLKSVQDISRVDTGLVAQDKDVVKLYDITRYLVAREEGQRLVGSSMWGPFTLAGLLFGAEALMRSVYKDREATEKLLEFAEEVYLKFIQGFIESGAKVIFMAEPSASGDMISRKHFESTALPYIKDAFQRLSGKGLILGLHICGDVTDRLDLIADSGIQIMSLDYKVDLARAKEAFKGKIAFAGNLNPVSVVQSGTPEEIVAETLRSIETVGTKSGYIVMPGCDIPPSTPLFNLQTISRTVSSYKV
ncbi:MAG TPA: uroporphyrinogen decarboxylase family protein [Anaerovoracaceae bacterium]|nr:uroporphyrinogen decarboxylase family protein [Anaerovoracaceae bacterium]